VRLLEVVPALVREPAVTAERLAVVAGEDDDRVVGLAGVFEVLEDAAIWSSIIVVNA